MAPAVSRRQPGAPPSSDRKAGACGSATSPAQAKRSSAAARFAPATGKVLAAGNAKAQQQGPGKSIDKVKSRFTQPKEEDVSLEEKLPERRGGNVAVPTAEGAVALPEPGGPTNLPQESDGTMESSTTGGAGDDDLALGAKARRPQEQQTKAKAVEETTGSHEKNEALQNLNDDELSKLQGKLRKLNEDLDGENREIEQTRIEIESPRSARRPNDRGSSPPSLAEPAAEPEAVILADARSPHSGKEDLSPRGEQSSPWDTFPEANRGARQQSPAASEELALPGRDKKLLSLQSEVKYQEDRITKLEEALRNAYERSVAGTSAGTEASEKGGVSPTTQGLAEQGVQASPASVAVHNRHPPVPAWTTISLTTWPSRPKAQSQWQEPGTLGSAARTAAKASEWPVPVPDKSNRELLQDMQDNLQKCLQAGNSSSSRPAAAPRFVPRVGGISPPLSPRVVVAPPSNVVVWKYGGVPQAVEVSHPVQSSPPMTLHSPHMQSQSSRWVRLDASASQVPQPQPPVGGAASPCMPMGAAAWRPLQEQSSAWRLSPVSTPCATPSSPGVPPHLAVSASGSGVRLCSPRPQGISSARAAAAVAREAPAAPGMPLTHSSPRVFAPAQPSRPNLSVVSCTSAVSTGSATPRLAAAACCLAPPAGMRSSGRSGCSSGTTSPVPPGGLPGREAHIAACPTSTPGTPAMLVGTPRVLPPKRVTSASTPPVPPKDGHPQGISSEPATAVTAVANGRFIPARTPPAPAGGAPGAANC